MITKILFLLFQIKLRTQIATEQEKLLNEKENELEKIRHELVASKDDLSQKTEQVCRKI